MLIAAHILAGIGLLGLALVLGPFVLTLATRAVWTQRRWARTTAEVVEGQQVRFTDHFGQERLATCPNHNRRPGQRFRLRYDPADPDATPDASGGVGLVLVVILLLAGALALGLGGVLLLIHAGSAHPWSSVGIHGGGDGGGGGGGG